MRLAKGFRSLLCCLVILSVGLMVAGPAWARDRGVLRSILMKADRGNLAVKGNPAAANTAPVLPKTKGVVAATVNKAPVLPKTKGVIGTALIKAKAVKGNTVAVNKAPVLPKTKGVLGAALNKALTVKGNTAAMNKAPALPKPVKMR